jgi:hypothetical protein
MTTGLMLVKKAPVKAAVQYDVVREGSTGKVVSILPRVWAVGQEAPVELPVQAMPKAAPVAELAFYRKYTEALLRRYLRMSTEAGRVPSLLGREMFRGNVSSYRVNSFEDVVVFCMDVEKCLARLNAIEKEVVRRVALQQYTLPETAAVLGVCLRQAARRYNGALDLLTGLFLERKLLEPLKSCQ